MLSHGVAQAIPIVLALAVALFLAHLGGMAAQLLYQPRVIGEIVVGLLLVPAVSVFVGRGVTETLLPDAVLRVLGLLGQAGLMLFLVGVAYEMRHHRVRFGGRAFGWVLAGSSLPALLSGGALAAWVIWAGGADLRGSASTPAFVLLLCVALSVTAVPVLARILEDRQMSGTAAGVLAMATAFALDAVAWVLLALAIGLAKGDIGGAVRAVAVLVVAGVTALLLHRLLATDTVQRLAVRNPAVMPFAIGAAALIAAAVTEHYGLTGIFGALMVGLALPTRDTPGPWHTAVSSTGRCGRLLVPVFFLFTGMKVLANPLAATSWAAILIATALAIAGKAGGTYLGARLGSHPHETALRLGVLMNTRGLTEIVVLQAGYAAGILTNSLFLVLLVMTLVTTALTGPLLSVIDRREVSRGLPSTVVQGGT